MKSIVVVSSLTGNTLKLASAVAYALNESVEAVKVEEKPDVSGYDLIAVGCWINRGTADAKAQEFIKTIKGKKVAIFATLGAYPDSEHAKKSLENIKALFDESNEIVGEFICQGSVSYKMVEMMTKMFPTGHPHAMTEERKARIKESYNHPNNDDLLQAREYFTALKNKLEG